MSATNRKVEEFQPKFESTYCCLPGESETFLLRKQHCHRKMFTHVLETPRPFPVKEIVIAEQFYFHRRKQAVGETIADYVTGAMPAQYSL